MHIKERDFSQGKVAHVQGEALRPTSAFDQRGGPPSPPQPRWEGEAPAPPGDHGVCFFGFLPTSCGLLIFLAVFKAKGCAS